MKSVVASALFASLFAINSCEPQAPAGPPSTTPPARTVSPSPGSLGDLDITAEWAKLYADPSAQPGTSYRAGHVTPTAVKTDVEKKEGPGYVIKFPSGAPIPTPAVYKGTVFVSAGFHSKQYFAFEAATGKPVWGVDLDDDGPSTAAIEEDVVVVNTESCTIFTLEAATGKMLWSLWLGDPLMTAPMIANGRVFTSYPAAASRPKHAEASHLLGCFDLKTGKILWQRWLDGDVISAPVASGDVVVAATFTGTVFRFKQADGALVSALRARATSAPIVVGDEMYFSRRTEKEGEAHEALVALATVGGTGYTTEGKKAPYLDATTQQKADLKEQGVMLDSGNGFGQGAPSTANAGKAFLNVGQGNVATLQAFQGSRTLRYGASNYACMGDELIATNPKDGSRLWGRKLKGDLTKEGGFLGAPPVAAGDSLFATTLAGDVMQLDPKSGETRKSWALGHPTRFPAVVEGGRLFVGTQDGRLVCIDTGDAKNTGWAQWGANAQRTGIYGAK